MLPVDSMIYVIDDEHDVCRSLLVLLRAEGYAAVSFASADELLAQLDRVPRAIIISDVQMPGTNGVDLVERLREQGRDDPIILISGHADIAVAVEGMRKGAANFLPKPFSRAQLVEAIERVKTELESRAPRKTESLIDRLSRRERQVLDLLLAGATNKVIAGELGLSPRTIEDYRSTMLRKMGVGKTAELVQSVVASGYRPGLHRRIDP